VEMAKSRHVRLRERYPGAPRHARQPESAQIPHDHPVVHGEGGQQYLQKLSGQQKPGTSATHDPRDPYTP